MADVRIDTSRLTFTLFLIPENATGLIDGADAPPISLNPGTYGFQQMSAAVADFRFEVTSAGVFDYDAANDAFLAGRGTTTLHVRGFAVAFDATALSHDLLPIVLGSRILSRLSAHALTLAPASRYTFQPASGVIADFEFGVSVDGRVVVDQRYAGFAEATGLTLTMRGYRVTIDGRPLSHDLLLLSMLGPVPVLSHAQANDVTYIPAAGYGFQPASGIVADFRFDVSVDGEVIIDPRYAGFAEATGLTLTLRGYRVTIDGRPLSHDLLPLSMLGPVLVLSHEQANDVTYIPGAGYGFQPASGIVADFRFDVSVDGEVIIDPRYAGFAEATGLTLTLRGYRVTIDGRPLSHDLLPLSMLGPVLVLSHEQANDVTYIPGAGYGFQPASGIVADFRFDVSVDGEVIIDPRYAGFAEATGLTLTLRGYRVTIDGRPLSHDLLPLSMLGPVLVLSHEQANDVTYIPGAGYGFQPASGIVADFRFDVSVDGEVIVDSRYAGFAEATGLTLTLRGYRVTIDARALSHDLLPLSMLGPVPVLSHEQANAVTYMPAAGYGFQPAAGVVADFRFDVTADGQLVLDPRYTGFSQAAGLTLTIAGYALTLDTSEVGHDVLPSMLGWAGGLLSPGINAFTAIPAPGYALLTPGNPASTIFFSLDDGGQAILTEGPAGTTVMSSTRRCGVPDTIATSLQIQTYGSPRGRWSGGQLTVSIDLTNAPNFGPATSVTQVLQTAFFMWQLVVPQFFVFAFVAANANIHVSFGNQTLYNKFGMPGGVAGAAGAPEKGWVMFDSTENWTVPFFQAMALHEIGHALGLAHSDNSASIMFPSVSPGTPIDNESMDALRNLYGWRPQIPLADRATSDRPAMAVTTNASFTFSDLTLHMVWKGSRDDQRVYESELVNNVWTPQRLINGVISSESPSLTSFPLNDGTPSTGLLMAWKAANNGGLLFSTNRGGGWSQPVPVPDVGASRRPAVADFFLTHMAWKGSGDDSGIYWSRLTAAGWAPQRNVPNVGTSQAPALVVFQNKLFMFWKGVGDDSHVFFSSLEATPNAEWLPQQVVAFHVTNTSGTTMVPIGTTEGPSATLHANRILLAWKGIKGDSGIYFSLFDGNSFTGQINVAGVGSRTGPAVCHIGGFTHMLWRGIDDDSGIYWSTLPGA